MKGKIILGIIIVIAIVAGVILAINLAGVKEESDSLQRILSKGTFILGLDDSFPPMGFRNENNEIVGFDIDVAKEVSKRLGVELVLQPISWTAKEQELFAEFDFTCCSMGERILRTETASTTAASLFLAHMEIL